MSLGSRSPQSHVWLAPARALGQVCASSACKCVCSHMHMYPEPDFPQQGN